MAIDLTSLNPAQLEAVLATDGPLLVLAGAGSGKTRVLTFRIAHLIEDLRVSPAEILAITFTNKAAAEMRERVASLVGPKAAKELRVTTFHSFGLDVLSKEVSALGFRGGAFAVFDQADAMGVVRELLRSVEAEAVEGGDLEVLGDLGADEVEDALAHLGGGLVGEGHRQDRPRRDAALDQAGDALGDDARLAGACAGEHQDGAEFVLDGGAL